MVNSSAWIRSSAQISKYLESNTTLATAEKAEEVIKLFKNMHLLFPQWAVFTCPVMHPEIKYVSENYFEVFGNNIEPLMKNFQVEQFFSHVHDDDQMDLYDCYAYFFDYLKSVPAEEHPDIRGVTYYRFRSAKGQYIHLHDEKASLSLHGGAKFYYAMFQNLRDSRPFTGVRVEVFRRSLQMKKILEYRPAAQRKLLSKREGELVSLIRKGLSTKEIGNYLNISPNTVRNTKSKLFEKFGVDNSIELLNVTA